MDTFNEQIIKIRKSGKTIMLQLLIWLAAVLVLTLLFMFAFKFVGTFIVLIAFLIFWGAQKLSQRFNVEYEYIFTNGDLDIDKITNRSDRNRILTIKCAEVEALGKYQQGMKLNGKLFVCCNENDDSYYLIAREKDEGTVCLVFAPNEKMKKGIKPFLPRILQFGAFDI